MEREQVGGIITQDTVWDGDIQVMDDVLVNSGVTLQINPGSTISFMAAFKMKIEGQLIANGTADERIYFDCFLPSDFTMDNQQNGWRGLEFNNVSALEDSSHISYCVFAHSKAINEDLRGGAIRVRNFSNLTIENSIFRNNYARLGGAVAFMSHANVKFVSNIVTKNQAYQGGSAIYSYYSYPKIYLNTIVDNTVQLDEEFTKTGAVLFYISKPWFTGNIVRNNNSSYFDLDQVVFYKPYYTRYNNVESGIEGEENQDVEPSFLTIENIPFTLQEQSLCIDTVPVNKVNYFPNLDIFGQSRLYDGDNNGLTLLDYGAFEFNSVANNEIDQIIGSNDLHFSVYPSPFSSKYKKNNISISYEFGDGFRGNEHVTISLYDIKGRKLGQKKYNVTTGSGNIQFKIVNKTNKKRSSGVYFFKFSTLQKSSYRKFLICE
jgi:hypothetical protein